MLKLKIKNTVTRFKSFTLISHEQDNRKSWPMSSQNIIYQLDAACLARFVVVEPLHVKRANQKSGIARFKSRGGEST